MAISMLDNIGYKGPKPDSIRSQFETVADMVAFSENYLPPIYKTMVVENGKTYKYQRSNSVDPELGKWREDVGGADLSSYYTKNEIDNDVVKPVKDLAEQNETNIGKMTDLVVSEWSDLVVAINSLYNSFMSSITYTTKVVDEKTVKVLRITYRNGGSVDVDITAIVTDSNIGDLADVDTSTISEGQVLAYTKTTNKFVPKTFDLAGLLRSANTYTDEQIAESEKTNAIACDKKPTYDAFTDTVTYIQSGVQKKEEETHSWFYYKTSAGSAAQTRWISGVEFTIDVSSIKLDDYVAKADVAEEYLGDDTETKTKVANLTCLDNLKAIITEELGKKVNTDDIVDNLTSENDKLPLSAKQGKVLDEKITELTTALEGKLDIEQDEADAGKVVTVDSNGKLTLAPGSGDAADITYTNEKYTEWDNVKKALDGIIAKVDYVDPEITSFTMSCDAVNEVGATIDSITFNWELNKDITTQSLTDCTLADENVRTAEYAVPLINTKTFTLTVSDGQKTVKKDLSVAFRNKIYWGGSASVENYNSAFILGLAKNQFATSDKGSFAMSVGSGQYGYICMPSSFNFAGEVYIGGFLTTLEKAAKISFTNASGGTTSYDIYKTVRDSLGTITMEVK